MLKKVIITLVAFIAVFCIYVSTRPNTFHYERSGVIQAPAEKIFPYLSNFKMGEQWSPYEKIDPNMKKTFSGEDGQVGSIMEFDGNSNAGSGKLELLKINPNQQVEIKLTMTKPVQAENLVVYTLTPDNDGTKFSWAMSGNSGFLGKLISVFIDCEKMVGDQFTSGIQNLKTLIESQK